MIERRRVLQAAGAAAAAGTTVALAGCQDGGSQELAIEHVRFVSERPSGYRDYEEVSDATYDRDEVVWIYFEPVGVATESASGGGQRIDLDTTLTVDLPEGAETVLEDTVERTIGEDESLDNLFLYWQFDATDPALPGEYEAEVAVTDALADGESAERSERFVLGESPVEDPYVAALEMDLEGNLDATVRSVERVDGDLRVEYDSGYAIDTESSGEEVGYVIGRYTAYVADGLDTDELVATVHATDGEYRYRLSSERARAWSEGEVSTDEVVSGIYENLEEL